MLQTMSMDLENVDTDLVEDDVSLRAFIDERSQ